VESGHNIFITGQAGTGKSFLVKEIYKCFQRSGKKVKIVCSSGIAGTVYADLRTSVPTVHSFYGLQTADLPWRLLVSRCAQDSILKERVMSLDCLIWDEVSMSSRRILEIVNQVHIELSAAQETVRPFNGIQVILVGEFLQLRPVPNFLDRGEFMFQSPVFHRAITHRYELKTVMRQDENEGIFIKCLREVRVGQCTDETQGFIKGLEKKLPDHEDLEATHIFFKKISVQMFNINRLALLTRVEDRFESIDQGDIKSISCPAERLLVLKPGCKVMLVWNRSDRLRNGSEGKYVGKVNNENQIEVEFEGTGKVALKRQVWQKKGKHGEVVGTRTQFPLILMYAITCHKSQGQTLPAAVVHCTKEFVSGLIYVSFTRVRKSSQLQVLNFNRKQLVPPVKECVHVCDNHSQFEENLKCCRNIYLPKDEYSVLEMEYEDLENDEDEGAAGEVSKVTKRVIKSYFERGDPQEFFIDLGTVYAVLSDERSSNAFMRTPTDNFSVQGLLESMVIEEPLSEYANRKNSVLEELLTVRNEDLEVVGKIMWSRACQIVLEDSILNAGDVPQISSKQWSLNTK